ncbi:MAG TPA: ATP-binding cassette domain-containing protein [Candidatus Tyrphobacter sp.]
MANGVIARLEDVRLAFGERVVLQHCTLPIVEGAITCIVGLSGAGKSTILRLLDGLVKPDAGHVYMRDRDLCHMPENEVNEVRRTVSLSFQFAALLDSLTLGDNVALPLRENTPLPDEEIRKTVCDALESVGLAYAYDNLPAELSGGMLKRGGFARSIVTRPQLVLYDEPTTGLDPISVHMVTNMIMRLREKVDGTAVVTSHDLPSIYMMADYIAMLFEGAIIAYGPTDEVRKSENPIVQQFLDGSDVGPIPV